MSEAAPTTTRRGRRGHDTPRRILAAAAEAIIANGGTLEITDVARRAGVSIGLAYHHFGTKAGVLSALITDFHNRHDAVANAPVEGALSWAERERTRLRRSVAFMYDDPLAPVMMGPLSGSLEVVALEASHRAAMAELAAHNIADGQRRGDIPASVDAQVAGAAIIGGIRQAVAAAQAARPRPPAAHVVEQLWKFIAGGLSLEGPSSGSSA